MSKNICSSCGVELFPGKKFCHKCGAEVTKKINLKSFLPYILFITIIVGLFTFYKLYISYVKDYFFQQSVLNTPVSVINTPVSLSVTNTPIPELLEEIRLPTMIFIEGGTFTMGGSGTGEPVREVKVSSFYMGKYEVINKEYKNFKSDHIGNWSNGAFPVETVSWYDAVEYCNWLSDIEGFSRCYSGSGDDIVIDITKNGYRLPTEAEWEYACSPKSC